MDPLTTGLVSTGLNLLDGLIYTDQEKARDATLQAQSNAQQAVAAANLAATQAQSEQNRMLALIAAGAVVIGLIVWKVL